MSEVKVMNTIAIDSNALNGLFDNQKKLDDLFDSIFDDTNYFIKGSSSQAESRNTTYDVKSRAPSCSGNVNKSLFTIRHTPFFYVLPIVLEIALFYFAVTNLL